MKSRFQDLGKDMLGYGVTGALSRLSGFILLPLFTRVFSTAEYGTIDIIATFTALISTLAQMSMPSSVARYFYELERHSERSRLVSTLLCLIAVVGVMLVGISCFCADTVAKILLSNSEYGVFILIGTFVAFFTALSQVPLMVLRMERQIIKYNFINILHTILYAGLAIYFVLVKSTGLVGVFIASLIAVTIQFIIALCTVTRYLTFNLSNRYLQRSMKYSLPMLPGVLVTWLNNQADRLILLGLLGLTSVGIYGAAAKLNIIIRMLVTMFRQAWTPYAMTLVKSPVDERNRFYERVLNYYTGFFFVWG